jgi:hypothetical protein
MQVVMAADAVDEGGGTIVYKDKPEARFTLMEVQGRLALVSQLRSGQPPRAVLFKDDSVVTAALDDPALTPKPDIELHFYRPAMFSPPRARTFMPQQHMDPMHNRHVLPRGVHFYPWLASQAHHILAG